MCEACPVMVNHNEPHMETCARHHRWTLINRADGTMARRPCPECYGTSGRLEYLRGELRAERISYGELAELQSLAQTNREAFAGDLELLEAAGVCEVCATGHWEVSQRKGVGK